MYVILAAADQAPVALLHLGNIDIFAVPFVTDWA